MDTPSHSNPFESLDLFNASLMISAQVLIPIYANSLSLSGLKTTLENLHNALQSTSDLNFMGAFLTSFYSDRSSSLMMIDNLDNLLPGKVLKTVIHEREEIAGLGSYNPLQLTQPNSIAAAEYSPLADEVLRLLGIELKTK
jgi:cellulose biosynthesis protein BcsQ